MPSITKAAAPAVLLCCLQEMNSFQNAKFPTTQSLDFPPFLYGVPIVPASAVSVTPCCVINGKAPHTGAVVVIKLQYLNECKLKIQQQAQTHVCAPHGAERCAGCHFSTPGYVVFYLMRSQPQLMLRLQNGRFDAPGGVLRLHLYLYLMCG